MMFPVVDAYLGVDSPYSYLASTQLDRIAAEVGASFNWMPVVAADLFPAGGGPFTGAPGSKQYDQSYRQQDIQSWADYYGVSYRDPAGRLSYDPRLLVRAAIAAGPELRTAMMMRLFAALFVENRTRLDAEGCLAIAQDIGLNAPVFRKALGDPILEAERLAITERAKSRGVFGVPFFISTNRAFFGNDRLVLLERHLRVVTGDVRPKAGDPSATLAGEISKVLAGQPASLKPR